MLESRSKSIEDKLWPSHHFKKEFDELKEQMSGYERAISHFYCKSGLGDLEWEEKESTQDLKISHAKNLYRFLSCSPFATPTKDQVDDWKNFFPESYEELTRVNFFTKN